MSDLTSDLTSDDKIHQMVRAVLEAVDSRLDGLRTEMAQLAAEVEQRGHQVLTTLSTLERRLDAATDPPRSPSNAPGPDNGERVEQATKALIERIEAAQRASMAAINQRVAQLDDRIEGLRHASVEKHEHLTDADLAEISRPLIAHAPLTLPVPSTAPPDDEIDIARLTSLLSERLGHLSLPPRPD